MILLHQTLDDYVTPFQVYEAVINPDQLRSTIAIGEIRFGAAKRQSSLRTQRNCNSLIETSFASKLAERSGTCRR